VSDVAGNVGIVGWHFVRVFVVLLNRSENGRGRPWGSSTFRKWLWSLEKWRQSFVIYFYSRDVVGLETSSGCGFDEVIAPGTNVTNEAFGVIVGLPSQRDSRCMST
jgi:hypothetical protein